MINNLLANSKQYLPIAITILYFAMRFFEKRSATIIISVFFCFFVLFNNEIPAKFNFDLDLLCFLGMFSVAAVIMLARFGIDDTRFTINKLTCWHFTGFGLIIIGWLFDQSHPHTQICMALGVMIFFGSYPFVGWLDHFFIHSPLDLIAIFQLIIRPTAAITFALWVMVMGEYKTSGAFFATCNFFAASSLIFVPILLSTKKDLRRSIAYISTAETGFFMFCATTLAIDYKKIYLLAFIQGALLLASAKAAICLQRKTQQNSIQDLSGIFYTDRPLAFSIATPLILLEVTNICAAFLLTHSPCILTLCLLSIAIFGYFIYTLSHLILAKPTNGKEISALKLVDKVQMVLLLSTIVLIYGIF